MAQEKEPEGEERLVFECGVSFSAIASGSYRQGIRHTGLSTYPIPCQDGSVGIVSYAAHI